MPDQAMINMLRSGPSLGPSQVTQRTGAPTGPFNAGPPPSPGGGFGPVSAGTPMGGATNAGDTSPPYTGMGPPGLQRGNTGTMTDTPAPMTPPSMVQRGVPPPTASMPGRMGPGAAPPPAAPPTMPMQRPAMPGGFNQASLAGGVPRMPPGMGAGGGNFLGGPSMQRPGGMAPPPPRPPQQPLAPTAWNQTDWNAPGNLG